MNRLAPEGKHRIHSRVKWANSRLELSKLIIAKDLKAGRAARDTRERRDFVPIRLPGSIKGSFMMIDLASVTRNHLPATWELNWNLVAVWGQRSSEDLDCSSLKLEAKVSPLESQFTCLALIHPREFIFHWRKQLIKENPWSETRIWLDTLILSLFPRPTQVLMQNAEWSKMQNSKLSNSILFDRLIERSAGQW